MDQQTNRKKRSLLINPRFQITLIAYVGGLALAIIVSMTALIEHAFRRFIEIGKDAGLSGDHIYFQFISMQQTAFRNVTIAIAIVVGGLLVFGGLAISHKIAGPIYRMKKSLDDMTASTEPAVLKPITFRKKDFFPELADSFNALVKKTGGKV